MLHCSVFVAIKKKHSFPSDLPDHTTEVSAETEPEKGSESIAAIVGGVVIGAILAVMVVLFVLVILLLTKRNLPKGAPVYVGDQSDETVQMQNGTQLTSVASVESLTVKPDDSKNSMQDDSSTSKQNGSSSNTVTEPEQTSSV